MVARRAWAPKRASDNQRMTFVQPIAIAAERAGATGITYAVLALFCLLGAAYLQLRRSYLTLARAREEWLAMVDAIPDLILSHDDEGRILQVNRPMAERLALPPEAIVGRSVISMLPHGNAYDQCPYCCAGAPGRKLAEDPCFGGRVAITTSKLPATTTQPSGIVHVVRDLSGQTAAEERYSRLFHGLREAVFVTSPEGVILECNQALVAMLGYDSREELMQVNARSLYAQHGEQRDAVKREMETTGYVHNHELTLCKKDGTLVIALETSFATRDRDGKIASYQGFLLDITQSKQAEEEITRRNQELKALNTIADFTNRSLKLEEVLDHALEHLVELFAADRGAAFNFDRERNVMVCCAVQGHAAAGSKAREAEISAELVRAIQEKHIETLTFEDPLMPPAARAELGRLGLASGLGVVLWSRDEMSGWISITCRRPREFTMQERELMAALGRQIATSVENARLYEQTCKALDDLQQAQEQLLQSEKMSAVGQLISGVAHELNNPLTAILGYAQLMESEPLNERTADFVQKIFRQAQRTHRIVQNLLSFSRQRKPRKEQVDLARVLEDTLGLREYDLKLNRIAVLRRFESGLPPVVADQHQLEQVFLNIINNAVDAILEAAGSGTIRAAVFADEDAVCVEFHDSGPGLKDTKRIFDPFYTTKQVGKGTGLGLSICYGIVKEHGGEITAFNHTEGGAVFQVRLPAASARRPAPGSSAENRELAAAASCAN